MQYEKIPIPPDIQEFGERHKIPEFANATYRNGYVDGYNDALRRMQDTYSSRHGSKQA